MPADLALSLPQRTQIRMRMKPYILLLAPKSNGKLTLATLQDVKRVLGNNTGALTVFGELAGAAIGYLSVEIPSEITKRIRQVTGDSVQLLAIELGADWAAFGPSWSVEWFRLHDWLMTTPGRKSAS